MRDNDFLKQQKYFHVTVILIAKFYSFANNNTRFKDLDDIQSIFQADNDLDYDYILGRLYELNLWIPKEMEQSTPGELKSKLKR